MAQIKEKLDKIRKPEKIKKGEATTDAIYALIAGVMLGMLSKWLDNIALDSTVWWHRPIEMFDLGNFFSDMAVWLLAALGIAVFSASALCAAINVFAFFAGMCAAYHLYTIFISGFNPMSYMMIWYGITVISPVLAVLCWYAKGKGIVPFILNIGIFAVFILSCFSIGFWYIDPKGILYLLIFVGAALALWRSPKELIVILPASCLLALLLYPMWPFY